MPRRSRGITGEPRDYLKSGQWPDGQFRKTAPPAVYWSAEISKRLRSAIGERTITSIAQEADLARSTIYDILNGVTWPDVVSIVKLQDTLDVELWPRWSPRARP